MTLQEFFNRYNRTKADYDGSFGPQCKDLFSFYNRDVVGNPKYVPGHAWQLYDAVPSAYYARVASPRKGDIAIWKQSFGGFGHVAIVWDPGLFFSQNYPLGAPCSLQSIPTNQLRGYLRPIIFMMDLPPDRIVFNKHDGEYYWTKAEGFLHIAKDRAIHAALQKRGDGITVDRVIKPVGSF